MKENGVPFRTIHSKVKRIEALTGKPVDLDRLLEAARAATQSNRQQPEQDGAAQDTTTAETVARIHKHLQLVPAPLAEPDCLTLHIDIEHRKAAIYCDISTPPAKIRQLIEEKACIIAARLDAWGID